jgi:hypothetical protein
MATFRHRHKGATKKRREPSRVSEQSRKSEDEQEVRGLGNDDGLSSGRGGGRGPSRDPGPARGGTAGPDLLFQNMQLARRRERRGDRVSGNTAGAQTTAFEVSAFASIA